MSHRGGDRKGFTFTHAKIDFLLSFLLPRSDAWTSFHMLLHLPKVFHSALDLKREESRGLDIAALVLPFDRFALVAPFAPQSLHFLKQTRHMTKPQSTLSALFLTVAHL